MNPVRPGLGMYAQMMGGPEGYPMVGPGAPMRPTGFGGHMFNGVPMLPQAPPNYAMVPQPPRPPPQMTTMPQPRGMHYPDFFVNQVWDYYIGFIFCKVFCILY